MPERACRNLARGAVTGYRQHMATLMRLDPATCLAIARGCGRGAAGHQRHQAAATRTEAGPARGRGAPKRLPQAAGATQAGWRIRPHPPLLPPTVRTRRHARGRRTHRVRGLQGEPAGRPRRSARPLPAERRRVQGGGYRQRRNLLCASGCSPNRDDATLLLQLKEAQQSVLAPHTAPSVYLNQGQRVVTGQRIMQASPTSSWAGRKNTAAISTAMSAQLKDSRLAAVGDEIGR